MKIENVATRYLFHLIRLYASLILLTLFGDSANLKDISTNINILVNYAHLSIPVSQVAARRTPGLDTSVEKAN